MTSDMKNLSWVGHVPNSQGCQSRSMTWEDVGNNLKSFTMNVRV